MATDWIHLLDISQYVLIKVDQDIDAGYVLRLRHELNKAIDVSNNHIILDLANVSYIDSTGEAMILSLARYLIRAGGLLVLVNASERVFATFERSGITRKLPVTTKPQEKHFLPSLTEAIKPTLLMKRSFDAITLAETREDLARILAQTPLSPIQASDVLIATGEALGNVILHTPKQTGNVELLLYPDRIVVSISDFGPGFDLEKAEEVQITLMHGRGIKMMRMLVDEVHASQDSESMAIELTKQF